MRYLLYILTATVILSSLLGCFSSDDEQESLELKNEINALGKDFETFVEQVNKENTHYDEQFERGLMARTTVGLQTKFSDKVDSLLIFSLFDVVDVESSDEQLFFTIQARRQYDSFYKVSCDSNFMKYLADVENLDRFLHIALLITDISISTENWADGKINYINGLCIDYVGITTEEREELISSLKTLP